MWNNRQKLEVQPGFKQIQNRLVEFRSELYALAAGKFSPVTSAGDTNKHFEPE